MKTFLIWLPVRPAFALLAACSVAGCGASLPGTTTGSLFGGSAPAAPPAPTNDPTSRAFQVGTTAARAQKCGYNFDAVKLRTQFLAAETPALTNPADADKLSRTYDTSYRAVGKAVSDKSEDYCTTGKTIKIKTALARHIAGDYTPDPPEPVEVEDSLFGGSGPASSDSGGVQTKLPVDNR